MKVETKLDVFDTGYVMEVNKVKEVESILISEVVCNHSFRTTKTYIKYSTEESVYYEGDIFKTKQDLINNL